LSAQLSLGGSCCCGCGVGGGVGVKAGAGEPATETTLSTGGGGGGGGNEAAPGTGDEPVKTVTKTKSIIELPQGKSDKSILRRTEIRINGDFTYL